AARLSHSTCPRSAFGPCCLTGSGPDRRSPQIHGFRCRRRCTAIGGAAPPTRRVFGATTVRRREESERPYCDRSNNTATGHQQWPCWAPLLGSCWVACWPRVLCWVPNRRPCVGKESERQPATERVVRVPRATRAPGTGDRLAGPCS